MAVANNADDYAEARQNVFFTANNETPADGNLTGQCVTLLKWFFQDMCDGFPNPFAARGDARYVGQTLVNQGLATEVPYSDRRRGDIICYEFGTYGHIAGQLSGGRVFEENVGWSGVASRNVDGGIVYASRIGNENEAWRSTRNPHVYRLNNYSEGGDMADVVDRGGLEIIWTGFLDRAPMDSEYQEYVGKPWPTVLFTAYSSPEYKNRYAGLVKNWDIVTNQVPKLNQQIKDLQAKAGNCTTVERAFLDSMYQIVTKKG